ncbi:MAG: hypothetical protein V4757_02030 [Pseudomonadota bacterium]
MTLAIPSGHGRARILNMLVAVPAFMPLANDADLNGTGEQVSLDPAHAPINDSKIFLHDLNG